MATAPQPRPLAGRDAPLPPGGLLTLSSGAAAVFGCAIVAWFFPHWWRKPVAESILKLVPVAILMVHLWRASPPSALRRHVLVGLGLSLVGDALLAPAIDQFIPGLVAFLLAHLAYIRGLQTGAPPWRWPLLVPVAAYGLVMGGLIVPGLDAPIGAAVAAYTAVICTMAWRALARLGSPAVPGAGWMAIGALLFVSSDSMLAWARFRHAFAWDGELVILSYWAAQLFLAAGAVRHGARRP